MNVEFNHPQQYTYSYAHTFYQVSKGWTDFWATLLMLNEPLLYLFKACSTGLVMARKNRPVSTKTKNKLNFSIFINYHSKSLHYGKYDNDYSGL